MDSARQISFDLKERSYLTIIKKEVARLGQIAGLSPKRLAETDIVITEIGTNVLKHASGGEIIIRLVETPAPGLEILSIDRGPGMADPAKMTEDGISTTGTLGHGLGSIKRLSDQFQIYSLPKWGTILLCRLFNQPVATMRPARSGIFPILLPKPGETLCGDIYSWKANAYFIKVMLGDGLGHGMIANQVAQKAAIAFQKSPYNTPHQILTDVHNQVKGTRGLVATVGVFDLTNKIWQFCGVGNISSRLHDAISSKSYVPYNGIIGVNIPRQLESQTVTNQNGKQLIFCSDGISSRWDLSKHTGAFRFDPSILSAIIYKDYARYSDDTSVLIVKV